MSGDYVLVDSWWEGYFAAGLSVNTTGPAKNYSVLPRVTYGVFFTDAIDAYAGIQLGFGRSGNWGNSFIYGGLLGARYHFNDTMAAGLVINAAKDLFVGSRLLHGGYTPFAALTYTYVFGR